MSQLRQQLRDYSFLGQRVPEGLHAGIEAYIYGRVPPGVFLSAVICNDLREAFGWADHNSAANMGAIVGFFYNHAPAACWGSRERYAQWLDVCRKSDEDRIREAIKASQPNNS